jgi:hypothetical protein
MEVEGMKLVFSAALCFVSLAFPASTARDYYNELKNAGALSRYVDEYVCFSDEENGSFVVMSKAQSMFDRMRENGEPVDAKMFKQNRDFLMVQVYNHGVEQEILSYVPVGVKGTDYYIEFGSPFNGRMEYFINWATGRYVLKVFELKKSKTTPSVTAFGKCELIHPK